jgi:hypothetical protein
MEPLEGIGVGEGPSLIKRLEMVGGVMREQGMATTRQLVHRAMAMFLSHYPDMDHEFLGEGWPPGLKTTVTPKS